MRISDWSSDVCSSDLEGLEIIPVSHVDEVLARALTAPLSAIDWTEADDLAAQPGAASHAEGDAALRHYRRIHQILDLERVKSPILGSIFIAFQYGRASGWRRRGMYVEMWVAGVTLKKN